MANKEFKSESEIPFSDKPREIPMEKAGEYPFTRGIYETMYKNKPWTMRQYAGFGSADESNKRYKELVAAGTGGLSVAFDLPTQMGMDSDAPLALDEVGKVGVAIDSLSDMRRLFDGLPLDKISTSMTINAPAAILLLMYQIIAEERGISGAELQGTIQNDVLKEYIARGTYIFPPNPSLRLITDIFSYCQKELPKWNTISISGYHIGEAGATPVQEIAFTLSDAIAYVKAAITAGLDVDDFAPRLSFFFVSRTTLIEEVAKFRAARQVWARIMKEKFGAKSEKSMQLRFHTQTAGVQLTAQQPEVNLVRVTIQALAATLGGTQSLHTNSFDEALALPSEKAARLALRTQQVIANETDITKVVDPFAGSYVVENLTADLVKEIESLIEKIESMGGAVTAIESGFQKREIENSAYKISQEIDKKERTVVGVNDFITANDAAPILHKLDPAVGDDQRKRLAQHRAERNNAEVANSLSEISKVATGTENVMASIKSAIMVGATVGEICDALRSVWGVYRSSEAF